MIVAEERKHRDRLRLLRFLGPISYSIAGVLGTSKSNLFVSPDHTMFSVDASGTLRLPI